MPPELSHGELAPAHLASLPNVGDLFLQNCVRSRSRRQLLPLEAITQPGREFDLAVQLSEHPLSEPELELTFGPSWRALVVVVRQVATLTFAQCRALDGSRAERDHVVSTPRSEAAFALSRARGTAVGLQVRATVAAVFSLRQRATMDSAAWDMPWYQARHAASDAAQAAVSHHLVSTGAYTRAHYDTLLAPWQRVFGDPFAVDAVF